MLREHHKEMFEKLEAMQREVESIGVNVEKIVENCEYNKNHFSTDCNLLSQSLIVSSQMSEMTTLCIGFLSPRSHVLTFTNRSTSSFVQTKKKKSLVLFFATAALPL